MDGLFNILFFGIPIILVAFFGISLFSFISAKKQNKNSPGTFPPNEVKKRLIFLIVSAVLAGLSVAYVLVIISMMFLVMVAM